MTGRRIAAILMVALGSMFSMMSTAHADDSGTLLTKINALRASVGAPPLYEDAALDGFANAWTSHIAQTGSLAHNPALGSAPGYWVQAGENVGDGVDVDAIFTGFANSAEHYSNMVNPRYSVVGVATQTDSSGRVWVTVDFEQLAGPVVSTPAPVVSASAAPVASTPASRRRPGRSRGRRPVVSRRPSRRGARRGARR